MHTYRKLKENLKNLFTLGDNGNTIKNITAAGPAQGVGQTGRTCLGPRDKHYFR